ncbi:MAG: hypothetical protein ACE5K4_10540 [Candidatus Hydrothermarchaeota archaeon]
METLIKKIREQKDLEVKELNVDEIIKDNETYSGFFEVSFLAKDLITLSKATMRYAPSAIEIISPLQIKLTKKEFLEVLSAISYYVRMLYDKFKVTFQVDLEDLPEVRELDEFELDEMRKEQAILMKFAFEAKGKDEEELKKNLLLLIQDPDLIIERVETIKTKESHGFEGLIGVRLFSTSFTSLINLILKGNPVAMEILEPEEITISARDLQNALNDLSGVFYDVSHMILFSH